MKPKGRQARRQKGVKQKKQDVKTLNMRHKAVSYEDTRGKKGVRNKDQKNKRLTKIEK